MTDYAELRAALEAGPTPGPWRVQDGCSWRRIGSDLGDGDILRPVVNQNDGWPDLAARQETLNYIAACHPEAIRALLADHDNWRRQAIYETEVAQAAIEKVKEVEAERDALREALAECLRVNETDAGADVAVWANAMLVARAALAQGQGEA